MISIKIYTRQLGDKQILRGINLKLKLAKFTPLWDQTVLENQHYPSVLAGEDYEVTEGEVLFNGKNLLDLSAEDRARERFVFSISISSRNSGISNINF